MWGADPWAMCMKHLNGEHLEMHMYAASMKKRRSIRGFIEKNEVDIRKIKERHDALAKELARRKNYGESAHKSPMPENPDYDYLPGELKAIKFNKDLSAKVLYDRCAECRKMAKNLM